MSFPDTGTPEWSIRKLSHFPAKWPYTPENFSRADEAPDSLYYGSSRFVTHIDDHAIEALTRYYGSLLKPSTPKSILDLCGSWISHLPLPLPVCTKVVGIGMNEEELSANPAYAEWKVHDLNQSEKQEWTWLRPDSLDIVICTVSINYLIYPVEVLKECYRLLKTDGTVHIAISNRCFPTKVVSVWLRLDEQRRLDLVSNCLYFAGFRNIEVVGLVKGSMAGRMDGDWGVNDPLWVVRGRKP